MQDFRRFKKRRQDFLKELKVRYPSVKKGVIVVSGGFEGARHKFRQNSSFYYLTGIVEPAVVWVMYWDGLSEFDCKEILYVPNFGQNRATWVTVSLDKTSDPKAFGFDEIRSLSDSVGGHAYSTDFKQDQYMCLLDDLRSFVQDEHACVFNPVNNYFEQRKLWEYWQQCVPELRARTKDVSSVLFEMRRVKDVHELESIRDAITITGTAYQVIAEQIKPGMFEYDVKALVDYVFAKQGNFGSSFPGIVASGKNSTVLHYSDCNKRIEDGDLVLIDIGVEYDHYAADLTRTFPASGKFTKRQKEIYELVLATQEYVASQARPGMFLRNDREKERSLNYLAVKFLEERGYAQYFPHRIGHYLGLDVHDVGDYNVPLSVGDVFTIEPGVYIPEENLGVRIEDDYVMRDNGAVCLSADIPKICDEIELMMLRNL